MREEIIGDCRLILGDCRDILPTLGKVDVVVLDPPFDAWSDAPRVESDTIIAFCSPPSRRSVEAKLGVPRSELVWHFTDGRWVSETLPRVTHDYIYIYGKTGSAACGPDQEQIVMRKGMGAIGRDTNLGARIYAAKPRRHLNSVLMFPRNMSAPLGAWQKPLELMETLIDWSAGKFIMDPFMGSGTTGVAAMQLGRKFIGVEIDLCHFDIACRRIEEAYKQPRLFAEPVAKPVQDVLI